MVSNWERVKNIKDKWNEFQLFGNELSMSFLMVSWTRVKDASLIH